MFVKPAHGLRVLDEISRLPLPAEGKEVADDDIYWNRRLRSRDVLLVEPQQVKASKAKAGE